MHTRKGAGIWYLCYTHWQISSFDCQRKHCPFAWNNYVYVFRLVNILYTVYAIYNSIGFKTFRQSTFNGDVYWFAIFNLERYSSVLKSLKTLSNTFVKFDINLLAGFNKNDRQRSLNLTKIRGCIEVLLKGKQFLLHMWHSLCKDWHYFCK